MAKYEVVEFVEINEGWNFQGESYSKSLDPPKIYEDKEEALREADRMSRNGNGFYHIQSVEGQ